MISAISWIPKGASKPVPEEAEPPSKEEIDELVKSGALERDDDDESEDEDGDMEVDATKQSGEAAKSSKAAMSDAKFNDITDGLRELDMDNYDDEDEGIEIFSTGLGDLYYPCNDLDPYIKEKDDDDSEELEDLTISPTDAVIVCARSGDDVSQLEALCVALVNNCIVVYKQVWVCEESDDGELNTYVHHDVIISAFPLSTAWLDCPLKGGEKGNFIAVGSMEPSIEIWDLDIIDEVQPCLILGGIVEKKKKKGKKTSIKYKEDSHTDSVLGLAWNKEYRNILASASADRQVKIWDVATAKCTITTEHHTDKARILNYLTYKEQSFRMRQTTEILPLYQIYFGDCRALVQAVAWNHHAPQVLLSGSFDHSVVMKDGRIPSHSGYRWKVTADVESLGWDPHTEHSFVVSLEDGTLKGFDIRTATSDPAAESRPSFTLHAHDKSVCTISYNPSAPNLLATGSTDKMVKLWDLSNNQPSCVASRNPKLGAVFSVSFSEDSPYLLAIGGSKGLLEVWDTSSDAGISRRFWNFNKPRRPQPGS
ncbi:hypothetical protein FEM48_Zijuj08G0095800 [Ziziphus jujuba var. spinosa]|uniref:Periodic tryptophan protein 1 homolog n=1 Tax=Ziziphus jujuba var. spinosa TaxID=714518 RepID=A0A978UYC1_ZIZJJ|nr:hypothetical protein FEM48_Zijuj08G0095800 [Ziziphus jujuba var. spinosa]